ncbi:MAG: hypothetical protein A3H98_01415 [Bacteroidetes bacterium RIFCSPLOWO2_02_FULL_36_8]|nr:MAG: hypothetical protein A3H98_01415 [Bacteroidetes bacterium RIFCSPLOWO2_02_FULL_36_8]OFY70908.1 MAG: hypothetical protein A3G23_12370 [Bacteroidetes bacterium RIFCSPLOWO2_12_FULL_37_12]
MWFTKVLRFYPPQKNKLHKPPKRYLKTSIVISTSGLSPGLYFCAWVDEKRECVAIQKARGGAVRGDLKQHTANLVAIPSC